MACLDTTSSSEKQIITEHYVMYASIFLKNVNIPLKFILSISARKKFSQHFKDILCSLKDGSSTFS